MFFFLPHLPVASSGRIRSRPTLECKMTLFLALVAIVSVVAGAIASVSGFGIGSLLTPVLSIRVGTKLAVASVFRPAPWGHRLTFVDPSEAC